MSRNYAGLFGTLLAVSLMQVAIAGIANAGAYEDALLAYNQGDFATALKLYRPLAERGDTRAQDALGRMYAKGEGVPKDETEAKVWFHRATDQTTAISAYNRSDFATALRLYRPLAEHGQILAQYAMGLMYANGQGVPQNFAEAMKWHRKAADQGEAKAQFSVGVMNFKGLGTPQNYAEASKWYRRAADQGDATAQFNLGAMYAKGQAVAHDDVTALMLFTLASGRGIRGATEAREKLVKSMSAAQIAEAENLAHEWKPKPEQE